MKTAIENSNFEMTKVQIALPKGCDRDSLSVTALDSVTRDLAYQTLITVEGKILPCTGFKLKNGGLLLEIQEGFFEVTEQA